jgi:biotin operon repressor
MKTEDRVRASEQNRWNVCQALNERPKCTNELSAELGMSKNKVTYSIKCLLEGKYIRVSTPHYMNKLYSLTAEPFIPEVFDYPKDKIVSEKTMPKQIAQVYLNSMRDPSDYAWQKKKSSGATNMQSSMQLWSNA